MTRLSFLGIVFSIFILAAAGQVSAEVSKETVNAPDNLTEMQKTEWEIGAYSGWLRLCGYGSKSTQISGFMKKSPYFRKGETKMSKFDFGTSCTSSNEGLNQILGEKEEWIRYLNITYNPQANKSAGQYDGLWAGTGIKGSGNCLAFYRSTRLRLSSFRIELMVRKQQISGRVVDYNIGGHRYFVGASIRGTVNENGEFDLHVGKTGLGDELLLRGMLPKEGDRAKGEWDTPNCHGKLSLTRDYRVY